MCPDSAKQVAVVTSCSRRLYDQQVFGKCLDTWHNLPYDKYLFTEDALRLPGFHDLDLAALCDLTGYFLSPRSKATTRFYRKALPIYWTLTNLDYRYVMWLDSDVEILQPIDVEPEMMEPIATMFYPAPGQIDSVLSHGAVDTGMIWFDRQQLPTTFATDYIRYWHADKLHTLTKPKDTFVLIDMLQRYPMQNLMLCYEPLPSGSNYFDHTIYEHRMHHHIGRANK